MVPEQSFYKVVFENVSSTPFFVIAENYGDAEQRALTFARAKLEYKCWSIRSIKLIAAGCDVIGTLVAAKEETK